MINYKLILIINLDKETQLQVLKIRNEKSIRKQMFNEDEISTNEHFSWIERLKTDQSQQYFIIIDESQQPVGAVNLKRIDNNKNAELGFYKSINHDEKGMMTKCLSVFIDYSFNTLGLEKIYSEAIEGNQKSINIHRRLLFLDEGFLRSHIIKDGKRVGLYLYGLLKDEWNIGKKDIDLQNDISIEIKHV